MNFKEELKDRVDHIEAILKEYLPKEEGWQKTVIAAMNYSVLAGGKRLRPMLMEEAYRLFGGKGREIEPFMAAIEMIHTYSLVHDDLPAMDNDEYRRGRKTTHVVYGEAMAILAGDGLLNYAFETAMKSFTMEGDLEKKARALSVLAQKAGIYGMIGGQTADIEAEDLGDQVTTEYLMFIHAHKTSALIEAAMMTGAILAGASQEETAQIEKAAYEIGIAFQIQDDILDVTSTLEMLGKPIGSDAKNHKTTYVTLKGLEESRKEQQELSLHAIETIRSIGYSNDFLMELVTSLITREK
ncbi:MAG: polyprenyl synthetase family protein [Lachnospiraceae bacterium]|nr:polyprenyl synthetase family protein [Lachnospiraceae bacterium]